MKAGKNFDINIIVRFLMEEASSEEVRLLEDWIAVDSENREYFDQIRDTWDAIELNKALDDNEIQNDLEKVLNRLESGQESKKDNKNKKSVFGRSLVFKIAAVFILGFCISWLLFNSNKTVDTDAKAYNIIETPKGSSSTVFLPDGSKIILNAESKLRYPQKFARNEREVFLEGEAFFEVAEDKRKQFLVKTSDLTIKVFGTSFNVKSYPEDESIETTLVEGSISIYKTSPNGQSGEEIKLAPNQQIVLFKEQPENGLREIEPKKIGKNPAGQSSMLLTKGIDTGKYTSWKDGQLIFKSEPMNKLAITLERRYNMHIHFTDEEAKEYRFTGTIEKETIEQVMTAVALASPVRYSIKDRDIWISKKEN